VRSDTSKHSTPSPPQLGILVRYGTVNVLAYEAWRRYTPLYLIVMYHNMTPTVADRHVLNNTSSDERVWSVNHPVACSVSQLSFSVA